MKKVSVLVGLVAIGGVLSCSSSSSPEDDGAGACDVQDAIFLADVCKVGMLWDINGCRSSSDGKVISPPEGFLQSESYKTGFQNRCQQAKGGNELACYAKICRALAAKYGTPKEGGPRLDRIFSAMHPEEDCAGAPPAPRPDAECEANCWASNIATDPIGQLTACAGTTWSECETCEETARVQYRACVSKCSTMRCGNGVLDGTETDVDCGDGCAPCADGKKCFKGEDCVSGVCSANVCAPASCSDGRRNGIEAGIDCGAACNVGCAENQQCVENIDCASGNCFNGYVCH